MKRKESPRVYAGEYVKKIPPVKRLRISWVTQLPRKEKKRCWPEINRTYSIFDFGFWILDWG
ncbi:MAG: hypothetical protein EAZ86_18555 [Oscillatoriales cyanobacterium]|nr:MAG: hypothetical protein EAZ86_18555 [Oscillatoriales cyanobacterium]